MLAKLAELLRRTFETDPLKPFERGRLRKVLERLSARLDTREAGRRVHAAVEMVRAQRPLRRVLVKASGRIYAVRVEDIDPAT